ncbi:hypothetical protein B0H34DRAFT_710333, partial [Crassisporium funariophilum]
MRYPRRQKISRPIFALLFIHAACANIAPIPGVATSPPGRVDLNPEGGYGVLESCAVLPFMSTFQPRFGLTQSFENQVSSFSLSSARCVSCPYPALHSLSMAHPCLLSPRLFSSLRMVWKWPATLYSTSSLTPTRHPPNWANDAWLAHHILRVPSCCSARTRSTHCIPFLGLLPLGPCPRSASASCLYQSTRTVSCNEQTRSLRLHDTSPHPRPSVSSQESTAQHRRPIPHLSPYLEYPAPFL